MNCLPWVTVDQLKCAGQLPAGFDGDLAAWQAELQIWLDLANDILKTVSGLGICEITETACRPGSIGCGCLSIMVGRTCDHVDALELRGPVRQVVAVTIGGEPQDLNQISVVDGRWLYHEDGWPDVLDPDIPSVTVTYQYGHEPNALATRAVSELACQWAAPRSGCMPPANVIEISRRGVRWRLPDPATGTARIMNGLGVPLVDMWIASRVAEQERSADSWDIAIPGGGLAGDVTWSEVTIP